MQFLLFVSEFHLIVKHQTTWRLAAKKQQMSLLMGRDGKNTSQWLPGLTLCLEQREVVGSLWRVEKSNYLLVCTLCRHRHTLRVLKGLSIHLRHLQSLIYNAGQWSLSLTPLLTLTASGVCDRPVSAAIAATRASFPAHHSCTDKNKVDGKRSWEVECQEGMLVCSIY